MELLCLFAGVLLLLVYMLGYVAGREDGRRWEREQRRYVQMPIFSEEPYLRRLK